MREGLIILVALIGAGLLFITLINIAIAVIRNLNRKIKVEIGMLFGHFCFHSLVLSWLFISQLLSAINSARRPVFCGH